MQEAHQLWIEIKKLKAGTTLKENANANTAGTTECPSTVSDTERQDQEVVDIEMTDLAMIELAEEPEDPVEKSAREKSQEQLNHILIFREKVLLFEQLRLRMSVTGVSSKLCILIDAQTSRAKVNVDYLEAVRDFLVSNNIPRYSICFVLGQRLEWEKSIFRMCAGQLDKPYQECRLDLLQTVFGKTTTVFRGSRASILQMTTGGHWLLDKRAITGRVTRIIHIKVNHDYLFVIPLLPESAPKLIPA